MNEKNTKKKIITKNYKSQKRNKKKVKNEKQTTNISKLINKK